jgi:gliding motility-associated lipoprotein GldH
MFVSKKRTWFLFTGLQLIFCSLYLSSCNTIDLYEKDVPIPKHEWASAFKPQFTFTVKDTNAPYQLFILLRHNDKYNYNNIWINLYAQAPGQPVKKFTLELPLATSDKGWLGTAMDDLYDHRIALTLDPEKFNFNKPGNYSFTIEQIMREDPLENVLDVGLRLERKPH